MKKWAYKKFFSKSYCCIAYGIEEVNEISMRCHRRRKTKGTSLVYSTTLQFVWSTRPLQTLQAVANFFFSMCRSLTNLNCNHKIISTWSEYFQECLDRVSFNVLASLENYNKQGQWIVDVVTIWHVVVHRNAINLSMKLIKSFIVKYFSKYERENSEYHRPHWSSMILWV